MQLTNELIVIVPIGPGGNQEFIADTIDSFIVYSKSNYQLILVDYSHEGIGNTIKQMYPLCDLLISKKSMSRVKGVYISLAEAYQFAIKHYHFRALLKLDTDALIIGAYPEKEVLQLFKQQPSVGIAGQYPNSCDRTPADFAAASRSVINVLRSWKFVLRPIAQSLLKKQYKTALSNDYRAGESVFGGAYFISPHLLKLLFLKGFLPNYRFESLELGDDHLFAILAKANGYQLSNLSTVGQPLACAKSGLPATLEDFHQQEKKIITSMRTNKEISEEEIRFLFRKKRQEYLAEIRSGNEKELISK